MTPIESRTAPPPDSTGASARLADTVFGVAHTILGLALIFVVAINVANASGRYLFGFALLGADELMVYTIIWMVMAAAILSLTQRSHISVNLLPSYATGRARHALHMVHAAAAVVACSYASYASWLFLGRISRLGVTSMGLGIPMTVPHAALFLGFVGLTLVGGIMLFADTLGFIRNRPHVETGQ